MTVRNPRQKRTWLIAAAAAGAMILSACGSSDAADDTTAPPAASSAAEGMSSAMEENSSADEAMTSADESMATGTDESMASGTADESAEGAIAAVATATTATSDELEAAKAGLIKAGTLTVCTSLPYPPFESADIDGNVVGFEMDVMDILAEDLGVEKSVIDTDFTGIKSGQAMTSGICDIAAAAMTINPERQAVINFSDPYYEATQALLVKADSTVKGLADLSGQSVSAQAGTTGLSFAKDNAEEYGYTVIEFQNITDVEQAVGSGNAAAGFHDDGPLFDFVKQNPDFRVATTFDTGEQYGFGAALDNTNLIAVTNAMIKRIKDDGTYDKIKTEYFPVG